MVSQVNFIDTSDQLRNELFAVLDKLFFFMVSDYNEEILELIDGIISEMNVSKEVEEEIFPQLVWWGVFCSPIGLEQQTIYQRYLHKNRHELEKKDRVVQEVLVSWLQLSPGFYYVIKSVGGKPSVFYLRDVFAGEIKKLSIQKEPFQPPKSGEILMGLLLPMGNDDSYTTLSGFYHIPPQLSKKILQKIIPYFESHAISPVYKFNPHLYPTLVKETLRIITENTGDTHHEY